jgi:hypothetical protein
MAPCSQLALEELWTCRKTDYGMNASKYSRTPLIRITWASHPDMQKIQINGFSLKTVYIGSPSSAVISYSMYLPASKPFDHALFEDPEAIKLQYT